MKKKNTNENIVNFNVKMDKDIKDRFVEVAKLNDDNASLLIRKFVKKYLSENSQLELKIS